MPIWTIIFAITLLTAGKCHCDSGPEKIDLSRGSAVAMAISSNIDLRNEALSISMAETDAARSWGFYNPTLNAQANGGVVSTPGDVFFQSRNGLASIGLTQNLPTGGNIVASTQSGVTNANTGVVQTSRSDWQSTLGLTLFQPLLKNAGMETTELNITLSASMHQESLERYRLSTTDTVLSVITSYNHLYTLRQLLESRLATIISVQNLLDEIRKRPTPGPLQTVEIANAEYAIAQRRKDLVEAERNVRDQEASLRYLIGMEGRTHVIPSDPPSREEPLETEEQALKTALETRADLKQLRLTLNTTQLQERVSRHQSLPELSVTLGGGLSGTGRNIKDSYRLDGNYWSAGMQFTVPLGNTAARNDYLRSKIRTEQVQNQIKALEWRIRNDVEADMRALISARLQVQTTDKALQYAEQRREEYIKQTRAGTTTVQDLINAETDLISARSSQLDALEAFSLAVAKLWRDTGVLLDHQGVRIRTMPQENVTENKI